jgi:hypothetical protein
VNDPNPSSLSNRSQLKSCTSAARLIITVYNDGKLLRVQICNKLASCPHTLWPLCFREKGSITCRTRDSVNKVAHTAHIVIHVYHLIFMSDYSFHFARISQTRSVFVQSALKINNRLFSVIQTELQMVQSVTWHTDFSKLFCTSKMCHSVNVRA